MNNHRKKHRQVALYLIVLFSCIVVGYALVTQILTITGISNVTGTWDIKITSIDTGILTNAENAVQPSINNDNISATFNVNLKAPGATAVYPLTVTNKGNINAKLISVDGINEANSMEPKDVTFSCTAQPNDTLNAGESKNYEVTVVWDSNSTQIPTEVTKTATITLNYEQNV